MKILQISNPNKIDSLITLNNENDDTNLLFFIVLIVIGLSIYLITKLIRKKKNNTISEKINIANNKGLNIQTTEITRENKTFEKAVAKEKTKIVENQIKKDIAQVAKTELIKPEKEEQSKEKYIGYNPINIFAQTEPLNYPYVLMPKPNSVIKFPRKGRNGRKGYKEESFKTYIEQYFKTDYQIYDDRFILVKNNPKPYEPDFTLIDEKQGINIFLDVEIDEPYEGLNDIQKRKPTHFQYSDTNRNNAFKNRGWIVIRFAEIQVHKEPDSCCRFIADVLKSINPKYNVSDKLKSKNKVTSIRQWTKEEAEKWSFEKYREKYLGITNFGYTESGQVLTDVLETELGKKIEEQVKDDAYTPMAETIKTPNTKLEKIYSAINSQKFISFFNGNERTIVKPIQVLNNELIAFCYVKNRQRTFNIYDLKDVERKDNYFTLKVAAPVIGLDQIISAVNTAINNHKLIRMKYTRAAWANMGIDDNGNLVIIDQVEAEESIRTIYDVHLAINVLAQEQIEAYHLDNNIINAYCNKREERRNFRFDRIGEIEILDL